MQLSEGRIPMTEAEERKADELLAGRSGTLTRDHDGRLLVERGSFVWTVDSDGALIGG